MSYATTATVATESPINGEVLLMKNADLSRFAAGGVPLLLDHDNSARGVVGAVDAVRIEDDRLVADLQITDALLADTAARGAGLNLSIGYEPSAEGRQVAGGFAPDNFQLLEISLVGIGADPRAGLGRAMETDAMKTRTQTEQPKAAPEQPKAADRGNAVVDLGDVKERKRIQTIMDMGRDFEQPAEAVRAAIDAGHSEQEFADSIRKRSLDGAGTRKAPVYLKQVGDPLGGFSLRKLYLQMLDGNGGAEMERTGDPLTTGGGTHAKARHVTPECLREAYGNVRRQRVLQAGTAGAAAELVGTDHLAGMFVEALRPDGFLNRAGVRVLDGLMGDVQIPRQTGVSVATWLNNETGALAEDSASATGDDTLTPHESGVHSQYSRKLLIQSDPSVEMLLVEDQRRTLELAAEAALVLGTGASGQPKGIAAYSDTELAMRKAEANGTDITRAELLSLRWAPAHDNADGMGTFLLGTRVAEKCSNIQLQSGDYPKWLYDDSTGMLIDRPTILSNLLPGNQTQGTNDKTGTIIYADWREAMLARWSGVDVIVDGFSAAHERKVRILSYQDLDIYLRQPKAFAVLVGAKHD